MPDNLKTLLILLPGLLIGLTAPAQVKIARIHDSTGYADILAGPGPGYGVAGTLERDDLFYCEVSTDPDWYRVTALRWNRGNQVIGYLHESSLQIIDQLPLPDQKALMETILWRQGKLADRFLSAASKFNSTGNTWDSAEDSLSYRTARMELESHTETRYELILRVLPAYFCRSADPSILSDLFDTMWADRWSASEMPSFSLGECFICEPDLVISLLQQEENPYRKEKLTEQTALGMLNHFGSAENSEPRNPEYLDLKKKLEEVY